MIKRTGRLLGTMLALAGMVVSQAGASHLTGNGAPPADDMSPEAVISAYRSYKDVGPFSFSVPTVVEVPFAEEDIERFDFAVFDVTAGSFEPYFFKQGTVINEVPVTMTTEPFAPNASHMHDQDMRTYTEFLLPNEGEEQVVVRIASPRPITSSSLTVLLDDFVALPKDVSVRARVGESEQIVLAKRAMSRQTVRFPRTTSARWTVSFTIVQPLRISELRLHQENAQRTSERAVRFLAQPGQQYRIYFDPDRSARPRVGEAGNLAAVEDVAVVAAGPARANPRYVIADSDKDGVPDITDNCVAVSNADQADVNRNGRGDACDDFDADGIINSSDNCPDHPNRGQADTDGDGIGDVCDEEESRITERYPWVPWVGIGFAALVLVVLFALTLKTAREGETKQK